MTAAEILKRVWDSTNNWIKVGISAGTNLIGKVSIDQTTDGTTNKVQARNATHDNFNTNSNLQINDTDVSSSNPVPLIEKPFKVTANFTRPADTTAYTALDAITDDTASPSVVELDLNSLVESGDSVYITNVKISVSSKLSGSKVNVWLLPATFTATNDNSELSIDDTSIRNSCVVNCSNVYTTALNTKIESDSIGQMFKLTTNKIYAILQASTDFTPASGDRFDIVVEGLICR